MLAESAAFDDMPTDFAMEQDAVSEADSAFFLASSCASSAFMYESDDNGSASSERSASSEEDVAEGTAPKKAGSEGMMQPKKEQVEAAVESPPPSTATALSGNDPPITKGRAASPALAQSKAVTGSLQSPAAQDTAVGLSGVCAPDTPPRVWSRDALLQMAPLPTVSAANAARAAALQSLPSTAPQTRAPASPTAAAASASTSAAATGESTPAPRLKYGRPLPSGTLGSLGETASASAPCVEEAPAAVGSHELVDMVTLEPVLLIDAALSYSTSDASGQPLAVVNILVQRNGVCKLEVSSELHGRHVGSFCFSFAQF